MESGSNSLVTAVSIQMRAEIVSYGSDGLRGELYSQYLDTPYAFACLTQMIEKMEEIFDTKGFPEAFMTPRVFGASNRKAKEYDVVRNDIMKDTINSIIQPESNGLKCTFEVTVRFRQNATWQGQILWAEKNIKQNFRSVLEMLKLMDEALKDGEEKQEQVKWDNKAQKG